MEAKDGQEHVVENSRWRRFPVFSTLNYKAGLNEPRVIDWKKYQLNRHFLTLDSITPESLHLRRSEIVTVLESLNKGFDVVDVDREKLAIASGYDPEGNRFLIAFGSATNLGKNGSKLIKTGLAWANVALQSKCGKKLPEFPG